jgi:hypothetical protein
LISSTKNGSKKSFHIHIVSRIETEISVGFIIGKMIPKNVLIGPEPSMLAASSISLGMLFTNPENINTARPVPKPR